jgi:hypothetical protein
MMREKQRQQRSVISISGTSEREREGKGEASLFSVRAFFWGGRGEGASLVGPTSHVSKKQKHKG